MRLPTTQRSALRRYHVFLTKVMDYYVSLVFGRRTLSGSCVCGPVVAHKHSCPTGSGERKPGNRVVHNFIKNCFRHRLCGPPMRLPTTQRSAPHRCRRRAHQRSSRAEPCPACLNACLMSKRQVHPRSSQLEWVMPTAEAVAATQSLVDTYLPIALAKVSI